MPLPPFTESGDLPAGVHRAAFDEVGERFGSGTPQRRRVFLRLERLCSIARGTGHLARMIVFGSFVTTKAEPNDVDVFRCRGALRGQRLWLRRLAALEGEQAAVEYWQVKRDGQRRGVVQIDLGAS